MPDHSKCWSKKKKKKPAMDGAIDKKEHRVVVRHRDVKFCNVPSFSRVERRHHGLCLKQHRQFEEQMRETDEGLLHFALTGRHVETPRQQLAFLIAKYITKRHVPYADLFESLQQQGGVDVLSTPNLVTSAKTAGGDAVINLLALPDQTLWNLYVAVPEQFRPAERPKPEPRVAQVRASKGRAPKIKIGRSSSGELMATLEQVTWACCDSCAKWRRLFNTSEEELPDSWTCSMHPDEITCELVEEQMDADEAWNEQVSGSKVAMGSSVDASSAPSLTHSPTIGSQAPSDDEASGEEKEEECDEFGYGGF